MKRWWLYQRERFPVVANGVLIAVFSLSAVAYTGLMQGHRELPLAPVAVAFISSFLFFVLLRIADEFKDRDEDCRYRPDRPIPRGLVTLRELGVVAGVSMLVQLVAAMWLYPLLILPLVATWAYLGLMTAEFFAASWLRVRPVLYLVSHLVIVPLVAFYASACVWLPVGEPPPGLEWFLALSYCCGAVLEIGRKIQLRPGDEGTSAAYAAHWGERGTVFVWLATLLLTAACAALAAWQIDFLLPVVALLSGLLLTATVMAGRFLHAAEAGSAKDLEAFSGIWILLVYVCVGPAPVLWRSWSSELGGSP